MMISIFLGNTIHQNKLSKTRQRERERERAIISFIHMIWQLVGYQPTKVGGRFLKYGNVRLYKYLISKHSRLWNPGLSLSQ